MRGAFIFLHSKKDGMILLCRQLEKRVLLKG